MRASPLPQSSVPRLLCPVPRRVVCVRRQRPWADLSHPRESGGGKPSRHHTDRDKGDKGGQQTQRKETDALSGRSHTGSSL
jgi:hypothetical protein